MALLGDRVETFPVHAEARATHAESRARHAALSWRRSDSRAHHGELQSLHCVEAATVDDVSPRRAVHRGAVGDRRPLDAERLAVHVILLGRVDELLGRVAAAPSVHADYRSGYEES
ncbi:MAG: hypothetical protein ABI442_07675 [Gemmatimonadaceae bacterium]